MEILGPGVVDVIDFITQIGDFRQVVGNVGGVVGHLIIGFLQLRTVHRIGTGVTQLTRGYVGDLGWAVTHMVGTVSPVTAVRRRIPLQRIVLQTVNIHRVIGNIGGIGGDICRVIGDVGGVVGHLLVSGVQLRTVHRIGTGVAQFTRLHVGDLRWCPFQRDAVMVHRAVCIQVIFHRTTVQPVKVVGDAVNRLVAGKQLRAVHCISAGVTQAACGYVGERAFFTRITNADRAHRRCTGKVVVLATDSDTAGTHGCQGFRPIAQCHAACHIRHRTHTDRDSVYARCRRIRAGRVGMEVLGPGVVDIINFIAQVGHRITQVGDVGVGFAQL
ncbi:Uncharacterised protein [Serratia fonticola]|nr:Uncharacterised protein [Serratia fonticola]